MSAPYYADELVTLYHGDSQDFVCNWLSGRADEIAQIVVTSPPYNMGLSPGGNGRGMYRQAAGPNHKGGRFRDGYEDSHHDAMPLDEYEAWQRQMLGLLWEAIPDDGAIFYNNRPRVLHGVLHDPLDGDFGALPLRQRIVLNRLTGIDVTRRTFCTRGEYLLFFAKPDMMLASHSASGMGDVWNVGMEHGIDWHPAPFPLVVPTNCIEATAARSVFDPYAGSGTTLLAAKMLNVPSIGVEKSERYCERIAKRLDQGLLAFGGAA